MSNSPRTTVPRHRIRTVTPLVGKTGICDLVRVDAAKVRTWQSESRKAAAGGAHTSRHLPVPDRVEGKVALWHPITIVTWALANAHPLLSDGLVVPPVTEIWSRHDIADFLGIDADTVRKAWQGDTRQLPSLPTESFTVEGQPFWTPYMIREWADGQPSAGAEIPTGICMTSEETAVLRVLAHRSDCQRYGMELSTLAGISPNRIYPVLARLERNGLISGNGQSGKANQDPRSRVKGRRRYYRLTVCGAALAAQALTDQRRQQGVAEHARVAGADLRQEGSG